MVKENTILFLTEGEKLDVRILNKVKSLFLTNNNVKIFPICLNIYNLYQKISEYSEFGVQSVDVFAVIQEITKEQENSKNVEFLSLKRNQISEIFLFFDYDGHDSLVQKYPTCIDDMLNLFRDETSNGKLYINYPMVESYKHPITDKVEIVNILTDKHYKTHVSEICDKKLEQISKLSKKDWLNLFIPHIKSTNHLFYDSFLFPENYILSQEMSQSAIYSHQVKSYINPSQQIMVLSSFAWFLQEYLGEPLFLELGQLA